MSGRMPSFIVVGIFIIMFLLAVFYTSCSSKSSELRSSLEQFEERVRSLTIKNSDAEKKIESLNTLRRELEEEKLTIQRQIEKKDTEINELNTKINEKIAEMKSMVSDKDAFNQQLKDCQVLSQTMADKNSLIEKLQKELNQEKQFNTNERLRLQQQLDQLKGQNSLVNETGTKEKLNEFQIPQQRFAPLVTTNTTKSISALFLDAKEMKDDPAREVRPNIIPALPENHERFVNGLSKTSNQSNSLNDQGLNQNIPAPIASNLAQGNAQESRNRIEAAQIPAQPNPIADIGKAGSLDAIRRDEQIIDQGALKKNGDFPNGDDGEEDDDDLDNDLRLDVDGRLKKRDVVATNPIQNVDQDHAERKLNTKTTEPSKVLNFEPQKSTNAVDSANLNENLNGNPIENANQPVKPVDTQ